MAGTKTAVPHVEREIAADAENGVTNMDLVDLERIADASTDQFRLETLQTYLVPQEAEEFDAWKRGHRALPAVDNQPWLRHIRATTANGVRWWRVRIVDYPLTDYSAYELHSYQANAVAGEDIYVADRAWSAELEDVREDFWLFDHETVVRMIYDDEGHFLRPELAAKASRYLVMRSVAVRHALPLTDFLTEHEPRLIDRRKGER